MLHARSKPSAVAASSMFNNADLVAASTRVGTRALM